MAAGPANRARGVSGGNSRFTCPPESRVGLDAALPDLEGLVDIVACTPLRRTSCQPGSSRVVEDGVVGERVLDGAVLEGVQRHGLVGVLGRESGSHDVAAHGGLAIGGVLLLLGLGEEPLHNFPSTGRVLGALGDNEVITTIEGAAVAAVLAR